MNYEVTDNSMKRKVERWLRDNDSCYTFDDIMDGIEKGHFQTHLFGDTWVLTSIHDWPQRRSVHIDLVVGKVLETIKLDSSRVAEEVCDWAQSVGADLVTGSGRPGWGRVRPEGWRITGYNFSKDLRNGQ